MNTAPIKEAGGTRTTSVVDDYFEAGDRHRQWFGKSVIWQHRPIEAYVDAVVNAESCLDASEGINELLTGAAVVNGRLAKSLGSLALDASVIACFTPLCALDPGSSLASCTYEAIVDKLAPEGVFRYLGDTYYGGGEWVLLAGFVGWHEAITGRLKGAEARLWWMHSQITSDGFLPEQVTVHALHPEWISVWERNEVRWRAHFSGRTRYILGSHPQSVIPNRSMQDPSGQT